MLDEQIALIKYRLGRSCETLSEAETLVAHDLLAGAVNRIYYACFYAVSALLYSEGKHSSKHSGVIAIFNQHWIKPGRLPTDMGDFYQLILAQRQTGDYRDMVSFEKADVEQWLREANIFVEQVLDWLRLNIEGCATL
jgi:uncharacterized protein (UPF0332 family)